MQDAQDTSLKSIYLHFMKIVYVFALLLLPLFTGCQSQEQKTSLYAIPALINDINPPTRNIADGTNSYTVSINYTNIPMSGESDQIMELENLLKLAAQPVPFKTKLTPLLSASDISRLMSIFTLVEQIRNLPTNNAVFQTALNHRIQDLLTNQLSWAVTNQAKNSTINVSLEAIEATYLKAYLNGTFVDRWGVSISQPDLTKLDNDTAPSFTKVAMEAFLIFCS